MKKILYPHFTLVYVVLCILVILSDYYRLTWSYYLTKPIVLVLVMIFFRIQTGSTNEKMFRNFLMTGFLFSAIGDLLLMFSPSDDSFFIAGLIAFLIAHLCYTGGFMVQIMNNKPWNQHWGQLAFSTLVVVYGTEFFVLNRFSFGNLQLPVMIYCVAITAMGVAAVMRDRIKNRDGYFRVVMGAVFFIISDSLLATDKFVEPFEGAGILILGTYFFAQYMIATGSVIDLPKNNSIPQ